MKPHLVNRALFPKMVKQTIVNNTKKIGSFSFKLLPVLLVVVMVVILGYRYLKPDQTSFNKLHVQPEIQFAQHETNDYDITGTSVRSKRTNYNLDSKLFNNQDLDYINYKIDLNKA